MPLSGSKRVHIVGVGGAGMSAIATVLAALGHQVTGSDQVASATTARLESEGIAVSIGHRPENLGAAQVVTASPAVSPDNVELVEAARRGVVVLTRAAVLSAIAATRRCAAVAGTHGKTTTSSMLTLTLVEAGLNPSFLVGANVGDARTNARLDRGDWMVLEADESYGSFSSLCPQLTVLTSVEPDHLDHYGSVEALQGAFAHLLASTEGPRIVCGDDPIAAAIGRRFDALAVGEARGSAYRIDDLLLSATSVRFELQGPGGPLGPITVAVPGRHNASNAAMAVAAALEIGAPIEAIRSALDQFGGVPRRFERRGSAGGISFIDDYGHLPSEIAATLAAARLGRPGRLVAVCQPHRYTRTRALAADFAHAFDDADLVVVTDVYSAGEAPIPGVTGRLVADAVAAVRGHKKVHYVPERARLSAWLTDVLQPGDLCVTLGAGDLTSLPDELEAALSS